MNKTKKKRSDGKGKSRALRGTSIRTALEAFLELEADDARMFAYGLCRDMDEAGELLQEASYRALKRGRGYDGKTPLKHWFLAILRNAFIDSRRSAARRTSCPLDYWDQVSGERREREMPDMRTESALTAMERAETARFVRAALRRLPKIQRKALLLCDSEDTSYEAAAKTLGIPSGTLRSRLSRGRAALRRTLIKMEMEA